MLVEIENRFRTGDIRKSDCDALRSIIIGSKDESELESAIYIFGRSCSFDSEVYAVCKRYFLEQPVPGLTAVCMRITFDYWGLWEPHREVLTKFLNISLYSEWYDEVLFACRFCTRLTLERVTGFFRPRLTALLDAARREGISELLAVASVDLDLE